MFEGALAGVLHCVPFGYWKEGEAALTRKDSEEVLNGYMKAMWLYLERLFTRARKGPFSIDIQPLLRTLP